MENVVSAIEALEAAVEGLKEGLTVEEALALGSTIYQIEQCTTHWKREVSKAAAPVEVSAPTIEAVEPIEAVSPE
jgi:hypothetical protein